MASERQTAANRRNAQKSSGPRTKAGKARARYNAYRHGLRARAPFSVAASEQITELARAIAGDKHHSRLVQEWSTTAAEAMLDLARLRRSKAAAINEIRAGRLSPDVPEPAYVPTETDLMLDRVLLEIPGTRRLVKRLRALIQPRPLRPPAPPGYYQQLRIFDRYEQMFAARRDQAIQNIILYTQIEYFINKQL